MIVVRISVSSIVFLVVLLTGCAEGASSDLGGFADGSVPAEAHDFHLRQELVNDSPIGPGTPQPSSHCPTEPGEWYPGSGRSTGTSDLFGDLTETEVYCISTDLAQLTGGIATWIDADSDSISMTFGAKLLRGFVYPPPPSAPLIGFAQFTGGTGKWAGLAGSAFFTGWQNGDGTATLDYRGTVYLPR
ncbi:MAG: hypothetical protein ABFS34_07090 [Gemmatimonadota bacterium]